MLLKRFDQRIAEERCGSPKAALSFVMAREARHGLTEHFSGGPIAGIGVSSDFGADRRSVVEKAEKAQIIKPFLLSLRGRPLARRRKHEPLQKPAGGRNCGHRRKSTQSARNGICGETPARTRAREHRLVIPESLAI